MKYYKYQFLVMKKLNVKNSRETEYIYLMSKQLIENDLVKKKKSVKFKSIKVNDKK